MQTGRRSNAFTPHVGMVLMFAYPIEIEYYEARWKREKTVDATTSMTDHLKISMSATASTANVRTFQMTPGSGKLEEAPMSSEKLAKIREQVFRRYSANGSDRLLAKRIARLTKASKRKSRQPA